MRTPPKTVDAYIASFPSAQQIMMKQVRRAIRVAAPKARETISYRIPFYEYKSPGYKGRLVYFGAFAGHVSLFVVPENVSPKLARQMKPFKTGKSTLQFPLGTKIPVDMIKQLVRIRVREIDAVLEGQ